jgi:hypothetical protein
MNFTSLAGNGPLPTDHIPENQVRLFAWRLEMFTNTFKTYLVNEIAPFASNLVGQVLSCPASDEPTHIRWILNDGVIPLTGIEGCKEDANGLCELNTFIAGMQKRIEEVDFLFDCYGNYTIPEPDNIINGQYPK